MASAKGDKYIIERDERDIGAALVTVATYDDWRAAKAAWDATPHHENVEVTMWFSRISKTTYGADICTTIDCK